TDGDGSHGSTSKTPSYTKSVSWHHYRIFKDDYRSVMKIADYFCERAEGYRVSENVSVLNITL
ncbi:hypothetical protein ACK6WP_24540, partial [Escherichia coli]